MHNTSIADYTKKVQNKIEHLFCTSLSFVWFINPDQTVLIKKFSFKLWFLLRYRMGTHFANIEYMYPIPLIYSPHDV